MSNVNFEQGGALGWDSQIEQESSFILLPAGEYEFKVEKMERATYQPSRNSSIQDTCPKAELTLSIQSAEHGEAKVFENLILHSKLEWKLSEFFIAIGQKKKGEAFTPNWGEVVGSTGRCKLEINEYTTNKGQDRKNNRVATFLAPEDKSSVNSNSNFSF